MRFGAGDVNISSTRTDFSDRVALVTGAASGIGRAVARAFAAAGANVFIADIDEEGATETARLCGAPERVLVGRGDVTSAAEVEGLIAQVLERFGRLDCAHDNAGISGAGFNPTADIMVDDWARVLGVDLTGVFLCMKYEIPAMLSNAGGAIVNTASALGLVGIAGQPPYVAAKHGVVGLTKAAALEYSACGVRVNAICPGAIRTPMFEAGAAADPSVVEAIEAAHPIGRVGDPQEIASAVLWMCSAEASYMTGHPMVVDGRYVLP
jgi:NAD(P)-dependent dehydrogenase (short-subunit alcohol dehydrogenase family)